MRKRGIEEAELRRLMAADGKSAEEAVDPRDIAALAELLAAARTDTGETDLLRGEEAALAAFRAAHPAHSASSGARFSPDGLRPTGRGRTVTFALSVAALLTTGVAVAAGVTGHMPLPYPFHHRPQPIHSSASPSPDAPQPPPPHTTPRTEPTVKPATTQLPRVARPAHPHTRQPGDGPSAPASGHQDEHKAVGKTNSHGSTKRPHAKQPNAQQLDAQCRAHHKHPDTDPPATLTRAAGSPQNVDEFCTNRPQPTGKPAHTPHSPSEKNSS